METLLRYRGRAVTRADVHQIRALVAAHPEQSRRALSETLCNAWDWRQANGASRAMVCRGLMLALWRAGHIQLPAVRRRPPNPLGVRTRPEPVTVDTTALRISLHELGPLTFVQVRRTPEEAHFNSLMQAHHYLGYAQPVGEHLKFMSTPGRGRSHCLPGARRHGIWGPVIASSAGRPRSGERTSPVSPTTRDT
ncbi:MAG: hypothetical protein WDM77_06300 [Steroidobacteraceae bacterium]